MRRQRGTVREDYPADGIARDYFPHDNSLSRAYRWGGDMLLGICYDQGLQRIAVALWNEADSIFNDRAFGLSGSEGNHGEDVEGSRHDKCKRAHIHPAPLRL
jgi:hypothetical protein